MWTTGTRTDAASMPTTTPTRAADRAGATSMRAIVRKRYGSPDVMEQCEIEQPAIAHDEAMLVRVRAVSINAYDWHMLRGKPYIARPDTGLLRPKSPKFGVDAAGIVEAVGPAVTHVSVGDPVFGSRDGSFAEYVSGRMFQ